MPPKEPIMLRFLSQILPLLLLAGCYQPDFSKTFLRCDAANGNRCPDGTYCLAGYCGPPFPPDVLNPPATDAATMLVDASAPPPDAAGYDWSSVKRTSSNACALGDANGNAYVLGARVVACLHLNQTLRAVCKAPFVLCNANPLSDVACRAIPWGFFAGGNSISLQPTAPPPVKAGCASWGDPNLNVRIIYGCGTSQGTPTYDSAGPCNGFSRAVPVQSRVGQPTYWWVSSTSADPGFAAPTDNNDGALCCCPTC
ncbi:MAG: hypothetical protein E6Q97_20205 [Desulfurellales bacterium]|nr:MAG: hypothetical protein E6Q97_20205 [Desulfurellales bacterium]